MRRQLVAEAVGTFAMVFAGTGAIVINHVTGGTVGHVGIGLTFGLVVMAMIYAVGGISGAHFNPAVTVAFWLSGRLPGRQVAPYVLCQLAAAIAASATIRLLFGNVASLGATLPRGPDVQSFVLELILTFVLVFVILRVATGSKEVGTMAGIAIGGTVGLEALFAGQICGASMNPVRSIGPALVSGQLQSLWLYVVAPMIGASLAVPVWQLTGGPFVPATPAPPTP